MTELLGVVLIGTAVSWWTRGPGRHRVALWSVGSLAESAVAFAVAMAGLSMTLTGAFERGVISGIVLSAITSAFLAISGAIFFLAAPETFRFLAAWTRMNRLEPWRPPTRNALPILRQWREAGGSATQSAESFLTEYKSNMTVGRLK